MEHLKPEVIVINSFNFKEISGLFWIYYFVKIRKDIPEGAMFR